MTGYGVLLVARHEFRVRLRSGRWIFVLLAWAVVLLLFSALLSAAFRNDAQMYGDDQTVVYTPGVPFFGNLMLFVLALVLIVSPAITAQSINGDRERGTLATLQTTRLSALEIAVGKLLAGWAVGLGALAMTLPFVAWAMALGGVPLLRAVVVLAVMALLMGVICAVSQAWSAVLARTVTSSAMSYITVFTLSLGVPLFAALAMGGGSDEKDVWWMLAPNPFVVLADAAPHLPEIHVNGHELEHAGDTLGDIGGGVRDMRVDRGGRDAEDLPPVWPYGLGANLALGAGALWITVRRLRTPARELPRGARVA